MGALTSGVTENTPKNILLGPGTIHKGLEFKGDAWNFAESLVAATSGGTKVVIKPEIIEIPIDGVLVKTEGLIEKQGEQANMETNIAELTPELIKTLIVGEDGTDASVTGYKQIVSKAHIETGDYIDNFAYVGKTLAGEPVIIIFDKALCTSGFEAEGKNKEAGTYKATFECVAPLEGPHDKLPYRIYWPERQA